MGLTQWIDIYKRNNRNECKSTILSLSKSSITNRKKRKKKHFLLGLVTLSSTALQNFKLNLIEKEIDNGYQLFSMLYNYVSIAMKEKMKKGTTVVTTRLIVCASLSVYSLQQFEFAYDSLISPFGTIGYHFNLFFFISKSLNIKKKKDSLDFGYSSFTSSLFFLKRKNLTIL